MRLDTAYEPWACGGPSAVPRAWKLLGITLLSLIAFIMTGGSAFAQATLSEDTRKVALLEQRQADIEALRDRLKQGTVESAQVIAEFLNADKVRRDELVRLSPEVDKSRGELIQLESRLAADTPASVRTAVTERDAAISGLLTIAKRDFESEAARMEALQNWEKESREAHARFASSLNQKQEVVPASQREPVNLPASASSEDKEITSQKYSQLRELRDIQSQTQESSQSRMAALLEWADRVQSAREQLKLEKGER